MSSPERLGRGPSEHFFFCVWWAALPPTTRRNGCLWGRLHLPHAPLGKSCTYDLASILCAPSLNRAPMASACETKGEFLWQSNRKGRYYP